ncbi:MAG: phosphoglycerate dehydrogenase, partial [Terriglobales bacterium]
AEHTVTLMLALARWIPQADASLRQGQWERTRFEGTEVCNKTLGIIGIGNIGTIVAERAQGLRMRVIAYDPFITAEAAAKMQVELVPLDELYARADFISLHTPLTQETRGLVNRAAFAKMKKGVRLVNCARGELIDEAALAAALASGDVAGAALDVFALEPPRHSPLLQLENVVATPHIAGSTREAQDAVGYQIALQVKEYLKRGVIQNAVNVPSVSHEEYVEMQPYILLAERLGAFLAQVTDGNLEEISLRYSGRLAEWKTDLVRNAAIKGILNQMLAEKANLVNAASLAAERGIQVHENRKTKTPGGGAANVLSVLLKTASDERLGKGAVLHGNRPRLLAVDDIDIEAPLEGNLVYLRNRDVPGVIGRVGTILGQHRINIADFSLGRREHQGKSPEAIAVVHVDEPAPPLVVEELRQIEAVKVARAIRL